MKIEDMLNILEPLDEKNLCQVVPSTYQIDNTLQSRRSDHFATDKYAMEQLLNSCVTETISLSLSNPGARASKDASRRSTAILAWTPST